MAQSLEVRYKINGQPEGLQNLSNLIKEVGKDAGATSGQMTILESVLINDLKAGKSLSDAIKDLSGHLKSLGPEASQVVKHLEQMQQAAEKVNVSYRQLNILGRTISGIGQQLGLGTLPGGPAPVMGLTGAAGDIGKVVGYTAVVVALGLGFVNLAKDTGEYAAAQSNLAARTGLSIQETQQLSDVAKVTGVNVNSLTTSMLTLSKSMTTGSTEGKQAKEALKELGLSGSVAFEPMGAAINKIFTALGDIPAGAERNRLAIQLFGRGAEELLPLINDLVEVKDKLKDVGIMTDEQTKSAKEFAERIHILGVEWDDFIHKLGVHIAIPVMNNVMDFLTKIEKFGEFSGEMSSGKFTFNEAWAQTFAPGTLGPQPHQRTDVSDKDVTAYLKAYPKASRDEAINAVSAGMDASEALAAGDQAARKSERAAYIEQTTAGIGNERQRLEKQVQDAKANADTLGKKYFDTGTPADKKAYDEATDRVKKLTDALSGLKKVAEPLADKLASIEAKYAPHAERPMEELRAQYQKLYDTTKSPQDRNAILQSETRSTLALFKTMQGKMADFMTQFAQEGVGISNSLTKGGIEEHNKAVAKTNADLAETSRVLNEQNKISLEGRVKGINDETKEQQTRNQILAAHEAGVVAHTKATGGFSPTQAAQMDFASQMKLIQQQRDAQVSQQLKLAATYTANAATPGLDEKERERNLVEATDAEAKAKEAATKATLDSVDAINRFQAAADAAANELAEKFGEFTKGLLGAGEKGHAGKYVRDYFEGQLNDIGGNIATQVFKTSGIAGVMPSLPFGMGKGTLFGSVPKETAEQSKQEAAVQAQVDALMKNSNEQDAGRTAMQTLTDALKQVVIALTGGTSGATAAAVNPNGTIGAIGDLTAGLGTISPGVAGMVSSGLNATQLQGNPTAAAVVASTTAGVGSAVDLTAGSSPSTGSEAASGMMQAAMAAKAAGAPSSVVNTLAQGSRMVQSIAKVTGTGSTAPALSSIMGGSDSDLSWSGQANDLAQLAGPNPLDANYNPGSPTSASSSALSSLASIFSGKNLNGPAMTAITGTDSAGNSVSTSQQIGAGIAAAGMVIGGATQVMGGLKEGGAQGDLDAAAGVATMAATVFPPAAIAAIGLQMVGALFGDPRQIRQNKVTEALQGEAYNAPNPISVTEASGGMMDTTNYRGQNEVMNARPTISYYTEALGFSAVNGQKNDLLTTPERYVTPGALTPPSTAPQLQNSAPVQVVVQTMDSKSFNDNADKIATAMRTAVQNGHPVNQTLQQMIRPH